MQENGTLPVGPVEIGETHYANSRLGYSVFGARVWTYDDHKHPFGRMFTFVSRVIEKSALYLIFLLNTLLEMLESDGSFVGISTVSFWSDCGPNYRSNRFLGSCNYTWPARYRKHIEANFGLECHMKGKIDGHFGNLRGRKEELAAQHYISEPEDLVNLWRSSFDERAREAPECEHETYVYLCPTIAKEHVESCILDPRSLPLSIKSSHCWKFVLNDHTRISLLGKGLNARSITGVDTKATILPGPSGSCWAQVPGR